MDPNVFKGFFSGKKRRSRHSNNEVPFATKKYRRIFDRQFLKPRERKRVMRMVHGVLQPSRRAKSVRD